MKILLTFVCATFLVLTTFSQNHHDRFERIDVQHYSFEIHLNDSSNSIYGLAKVSIKFLKSLENVTLDFIEKNKQGKGMQVNSVKQNNIALPFIHANNKLGIHLDEIVKKNQTMEFEISYSGSPIDGLVISKSQHGDRTFFGDNWPDRAKHWLPCVDHPSDKATLEFKVYAPTHYEVISNGNLIEKKQLENNIELTHWKETTPISTKLMVIGVADFTVGNQETYNEIPVSSWVFTKDSIPGFENYRFGTKALAYFSSLIGPYSYEKLAHVQSKTRYGGMENASCIFYHERTATSDRSQEGLFAHEVAHQWFGNSVTEQNWHHVWLSEGFATYLTNVYNQYYHGENFFREDLNDDRDRIINYSKRKLSPIIDTTVTNYIELLNTNSYQKASWVLHMLRMDLGDELFFNGLRKYYKDYRNSTALTKDFKKVMEAVSGENLDLFFKQWLWQAGQPQIEMNMVDEDSIKRVTVKQIQEGKLFTFPLEVKITYADGTSKVNTITFNQTIRKLEFTIENNSELKTIELDSNVKLLFESSTRRLEFKTTHIADPQRK